MPGVYRVRAIRADELLYVGQTQRNLRERLRALCQGALAPAMPFNDPHTAAPALWALQDGEGTEFACSAALANLGDRERRALECYLLWQYRLEAGGSTRCNHGRFPPHYRKSGQRATNQRGGRLPDGQVNAAWGPSAPPLHLRGRPSDGDWMSLPWSPWRTLVPREVSRCLSAPASTAWLEPV
jgi:hypothetical protein